MDFDVLPKAELYRRMDRFQADSNSPISWRFLAELVGLNENYLREIFINRNYPISERVQIRVSKALKQIERGDVTIMRDKTNKRFMKFNNTPQPRAARGFQIKMIDGKLGVKTGIINKNDYSQRTLKEDLES